MFDLPETKRIRRCDLLDEFSSRAPPTPTAPLTLTLDLDFITVSPPPPLTTTSPTPSNADLFPLFSGPRQTLTLAPTPPPETDPAPAPPHRPLSYYLSDPSRRLDPTLTVDAATVLTEARTVWPACRVPHKVVPGVMGKALTAASECAPRSGVRRRPSKAARIATRKAVQRQKAVEEERERSADAGRKFAAFPAEERARLEKEDRTRKNREKLARRREKEKMRKAAARAAAVEGNGEG